MDRGKRHVNQFGAGNNKMYMDLKDVIKENALQFLPATSLFRFRSVCRDWNFQISTPLFVHSQSLSCRAVLGYFTQEPGKPPSLISTNPSTCAVAEPGLSFLPEPVDIRSSSYGLLVCQGQAGDRAYYVCNPVTQKWKKLPKPNADHGRLPAVVLVYEPSLLNFEADFKIVCAFQSTDFDCATEFETYSSKEGSWKISREISFADLRIDPKSGVHANGVVYWKGLGLFCYDLNRDRSQLLSHHSYGTLGTMDGKLCIASAQGRTVSISVLQNVHSNTMQMNSSASFSLWKLKERIVFDKKAFGGTDLDHKVLAVRDNFLLVKSGGRLYYYDFKTKETKDVDAASEHGNTVYLPYVNNFASL